MMCHNGAPRSAVVLKVSLLVLLIGAAACDYTSHPSPPDCKGQSAGTLEALPSDIAGIALDSARWHTEELGFVGLGAVNSHIYFEGRITSDREVPLSGLAVLVEGRRDTTKVLQSIVDYFIDDKRQPMFEQYASEGIVLHRILPGRAVPFFVGRSLLAHEADPLRGCPSSARLIELANLANHLGLTARIARDTAALLASHHAVGNPLVVLIDTVVDIGVWATIAGVAVNTTDRTLKDAAVWIAIDTAASDPVGPDTLSFPVGDVPPHALVSFGGGSVRRSMRRISRGTWVGKNGGPRVSAEFQHSVRAYRTVKNGGVRPSLVARDEVPGSDHYPWNPARFDLDSAVAVGKRVVALLHGSRTEDGSDLVVVDTKILYRRRQSGRVVADSARLNYDQFEMLVMGTDSLLGVGLGSKPRGDSLTSAALPGNALVLKSPWGFARLEYPVRRSSVAVQKMDSLLAQFEQRFVARTESQAGARAP
jgi:hypothetical protein